MLDQAGFVQITCSEDQKEKIAKALVKGMATLYACSCGCEATERVEKYVSMEICPVWKTPDGIYAELIDIQSGCFCLARDFLGENSYYNAFEYDVDTTYEHVLLSLFNRYPDVSLHAEIRISYPHSCDRYELYYTENGRLVCQPAARCTCCGKLFDLKAGVYPYKDLEKIGEYLDSEGIDGICSVACAKKLAADPSCDEFDMLEMIEDDGDSIENIIARYQERHQGNSVAPQLPVREDEGERTPLYLDYPNAPSAPFKTNPFSTGLPTILLP